MKIGHVIIDKTYLDASDVYNEGDEEESLVLKVLREGLDPAEILRNDSRWPVLYQLSPDRRNLLLPMDLRPDDRALEIGSGMGALTGALRARVKSVDCVELSERRSLANAWRNRDWDGITIRLGNFQTIPLPGDYDVATLVGVLEYAPLFFHGEEHPAERMLERTMSLLRPGGRLYIAIENRLGLKYFAGAPEDHIGTAYAGITGYGRGTAATFSRAELTALLLRTGWEKPYFWYPYPDYKLPQVIYSDDCPMGDYVPPTEDYAQERVAVFDEFRAQASLTEAEDWRNFANSFLVEAVKPV